MDTVGFSGVESCPYPLQALNQEEDMNDDHRDVFAIEVTYHQ
jgi:hypothetical protein